MHRWLTPVGMTICGVMAKNQSARRNSIMRRDVTAELKELRLHGMAGAWTDR